MTAMLPAGSASATPASGPLGHGFVAGLGAAQIVAWGTLVYSFPLLAEPTMAAFGMAKADVYLLASLALVVAAVAAYPVGVLIDRGHGRAVMTLGHLLACIGFLGWSQAQAAWQLYPVFLLLGLVQAMILYDAAFATVARLSGADARRVITALTLWGGFASTVLVPLTQLLLDVFGWRGTLAALAAGNLMAAGLVATILAGTLPPPVPSAAAGSEPASDGPVRQAVRKPAFWLLMASFTLHAGVFTALGYHLYPLLAERGFEATAIVGAIAVIGPAQVAGRIAVSALAARMPVRLLGSVVVAGFPAAAALLLASDGELLLVYGFAALFGAANGIMTIVRGLAVPEMLSRTAYGAVNGALGGPATAARAAAPLLGALLWQISGSYSGLLIGVALGSVGVAACFWAAALAQPGGADRLRSSEAR